MTQYHISPTTGNPNLCRAQPGKCPFGANEPHFATKDEARTAYEEAQGGTPAPTRRKRSDDVVYDAKTLKAIREHDTKLGEMVEEQYVKQVQHSGSVQDLAHSLRRGYDRLSKKKLLELAAEKPNDENVQRAVGRVHKAAESVQEVGKRIVEFDKNYKGWSRFYEVPGGHIHSSMACSTCNHNFFKPTQFGWLPDVSGASQAEAVKQHGANLCTVCYPDAPTSWTNMRELEAQAKKAERCPGSGTGNYDRKTARMGYVAGNYGICNVCGEKATLTSSNNLRGHKPKAA